jgi:PAS domain S-box-containing protein
MSDKTMNNKDRSKVQLLGELKFLRNRIAELEAFEAEHTRVEEELRKRKQELEERLKELDCLYAISRLLGEKDTSLDEIIQRAVEAIPFSLQDPARSCAQILLEDRVFKTGNFVESPWKQAGDIVVHGDRVGVLEVFYLGEKPEGPEGYEGPFLKEERNLLVAIAELLGRIIEQKQTEKALLESKERFRCLVDNSPTGIFIVQDGRIIYENPEEKKLFGPLAMLFREGNLENIHPGDVEKVREGYQKLVSGDFDSLDMDFRFYARTKGDSNLDMKWVLCRASLIEYSGEKAILVNKLDVTRAKEMEHLLGIEDKMASLGRVASGIAHEIRNPLSGINIYLANLEKIFEKGEGLEKVKEILKQIQSASSKIESVVRRVMDFSKPSEPKYVPTDINHLIEEAIDLSSVTLRKSRITLDKTLAENLPPCQADPHLIGQMILNLITNAAEAMRNMDGAKRMEISSSLEGSQIIVKVSDSGPGVPLHLKRRIFDPFFTTKNGSTGIGLSISHRIITDHGGFLSISTSKWDGAEFKVEIPIARGKSEE